MSHNQRVKLWSAATLVLTFAVTAAILRWQGRVWFCKCMEPRLWISEPNSPHTSQHLLDPYSLSHLQHGLLLYLALILILPDRNAPGDKGGPGWRLRLPGSRKRQEAGTGDASHSSAAQVAGDGNLGQPREADGQRRSLRRRVVRFWIATLLECAWEVFENSAFVINRYREATAALGYSGDSVWNSLGDVMSCVVGYLIAMSLGWRRTLVLFAIIEVTMILWIRDSLLLNVLMLIYPIEAIKSWQTAA